MRLLTCHIENFGKLSDFSYDFADGYNAFVLPNGAGKSTFAAFIRVMFYGFAGETKRTELEKERKRYQPWQGGTYGGQLTFTADGKYYLLSRVFGKTAKGDSFRLQDANTLLDSTDFTEQIGQELFGINAESFMRTIYIGQAECAAFAATDSVSAKLGDQMEETEDMASYDVANKKLADAINQLSDKRSTGKLAKLEREAHVLAQELRAKNGSAGSVRYGFKPVDGGQSALECVLGGEATGGNRRERSCKPIRAGTGRYLAAKKK